MRKRFVVFLLIVVLAFGAIVPTYANNHSDTEFTFTVGSMLTPYTPARSKTDSSPVYVYYQAGPEKLYAYVSNANFLILNSGTGVGIISAGDAWRIHTHVYESGYTSCRLLSSNNPYAGIATGLWSPDSVGNQPFAN